MTITCNNCFPACGCFSWLSLPNATLRKSACHSICWGIEWTRFFACSQAPAASTLYVSMLPHVEASKQNDSFQIRNCFPRHQKNSKAQKQQRPAHAATTRKSGVTATPPTSSQGVTATMSVTPLPASRPQAFVWDSFTKGYMLVLSVFVRLN